MSGSLLEHPPIAVGVPYSIRSASEELLFQECEYLMHTIQLQLRVRHPQWLNGTLLDSSEGGIGVSLLTPVTVGLMVASRDNLGEDRNERVSFVTVKRCAETMNGNFQAGLEFGDHRSSADRHSQSLSATQ